MSARRWATSAACLLMACLVATAAGDLGGLPPVPAGHVRLYLCRHGQTDWNAARLIQGSVDRELTALGRAQAAAIGAALAGVPLSAVASSDLRRAAATADAVHAAQRAAPKRVVHVGFREMAFGDLEGTTPGDAYRATNAAWAAGDLDLAWPGGEGPRAVDARARAALVDIGVLGRAAAPAAPEHVAVVAHGRCNKIVLASLLGRGVARCGEIVQGNCCINVVDVDPTAAADATDAATAVVLDSRDHLAALGDGSSPS